MVHLLIIFDSQIRILNLFLLCFLILGIRLILNRSFLLIQRNRYLLSAQMCHRPWAKGIKRKACCKSKNQSSSCKPAQISHDSFFTSLFIFYCFLQKRIFFFLTIVRFFVMLILPIIRHCASP